MTYWRHWLAAIVLVASMLIISEAMAQVFRCHVEAVQDGDTFHCHGGPRVRLSGIDAPEHDQPGGKAAYWALRGLIQARYLECERVSSDRYGRTVAICKHPVEGDIGAAMVRSGWAWDWPAYSRGRYADLQEMARSDGLGIWSEPNPEAPWLYRARKR